MGRQESSGTARGTAAACSRCRLGTAVGTRTRAGLPCARPCLQPGFPTTQTRVAGKARSKAQPLCRRDRGFPSRGRSGGRRRVSVPGSHLGAPALSRRLSCSSLYKTIFSKRGKMQTCEAIPGVTADPSVTDCLAAGYEPAQGKAENKRQQQRSPSSVALESTGALPGGCEDDGPSSQLCGTLSLVWVSREYPCLLPSLFPLIFLIFPFKICCSSHFVGRGSQSSQSCRLAAGWKEHLSTGQTCGRFESQDIPQAEAAAPSRAP